MGIRHAKSVHINTNATFAKSELAPKQCIKTPKISAKHFTLTISPRCTCSSSTVSTVWAANSVVLPPPYIWLYFHYCYYYHYHYNNDWWAGCGVIEEDLLDQVPSRTKRQQPDQGRNGPILAKLERWLGLRAGGKNNNWNYKTLPKAVRAQASTALISSFGLVW